MTHSSLFKGSLLAVLFATSGQAQFEIRGSRLYLDGNLFAVRGVAYSPTPIGETAGALLRVSGCVYDRDFPLIARAGANTVRLYQRIAPDDRAFWPALERYNLYVLAGFPLDPYPADGSARERILRDLRDYAEQLRPHKRVIAVVFGNEASPSAGLLEDAARVLRETLGAPAPLLTTTVADPSGIGAEIAGLSFWSVNVHRGGAFGDLFEELRRRTAKPVLISEFGVDAFDHTRQVEDAEAQSAAARNLARVLRQEMDRPGAALLGGVWLGFQDEWWRGGADPSRHGPGGRARPAYPDGFANAAWWGLFGLLATDVPGLDALRPRPAYVALAEEWGGALPSQWPLAAPPRLRPQGVVNAGSLAPILAPGSLVSFFGEALAGQTDLTSACLASQPVPLLYSGDGQLNGQVPWETPPGPATALVYRAGAASNTVGVEVRELAPGILERGVIQSGRPCPLTTANGVRPGAYLEIYGTGLGAVSGLATGLAPPAPRETGVWPRAFLGPRELRVLYTGLVPGLLGLYQTNTRVPEDYPPVSPAALRLLAGGLESNSYLLTVHDEASRPELVLGGETLDFLIQAGGSPQTAQLAIDARNGYCELVRFVVTGLPEGVAASIPVGFPGQPVAVTIQAAPHARGIDNAPALVTALAPLEQRPTARLRISVLPSRGDIAFRVISAGARAGLLARFEMAGRVLHEARGGGPGRGFSFIALDGNTGIVGPARRFDTWGSENASGEMADYLASLPAGAVVLGAIADEGTLRLTSRARAALRSLLGSQLIDALRYQDSWAIIGRVGRAAPFAEALDAERPVALDRVLTFPMP